jgi:hypothetical protein
MTTRLTFPASMFSVVCQRCGSTVRKNADSCPTCGADRSAAFGSKKADGASARSRGSMFEQTASTPFAQAAGAGMSTSPGASGATASAANDSAATGNSSGWASAWDPKRASERIAQKAAEHRARQIERVEKSARNAYADPDILPGSQDWTQRKSILAGAVAAVLLTGIVAWWQHGDSGDASTPSEEHSVSGAIASKYAADAAANAVIDDKKTQTQTHALSSGDPLSGVRNAMDQHDLTMAHARLKALSAQQQARPEYDALKEELANRELKRDAALQLARACERTSAWACVQQNAGEALAMDGTNAESQAMLERVIEHAGWAGTNPAAAKKALAESAKAPVTGNSVNSKQAAIVPAPAVDPSQTNVATVVPGAPGVPAVPNAKTAMTPSQKAAVERRAAQRAAAVAAARQASTDDAHGETDGLSRADKLARAQAATDALTAATVNAPFITAPAVAVPAVTAAASPPSPTATAPSTTSRAPQYLGQTQAQTPPAAPRAPQYIGDTQSETTTATRGAQYLGQTQSAPAAPATSASPRVPQYLGQPESRAPSTTPSQMQTQSQPRMPQPQYINQSSSNNNVPRPPASAQSAVQRVPPVIAQTASAQQVTATTTAPSAATSTSTKPDTDKTDALERAIKQYGWSGGNAMPKPEQQ